MWSRINRLKNLDAGGLHHSEWSKRLGSVAISAFLASVGFPLGIFLLIPHCAREIAGPSTSLSMLMAFVVTIITGLHLVEMCGRVPKSGCTYTFVYVTFGEIWAFLCAWTTIFDYCAMAAYLAKGWSEHFDFMFHGNVRKYVNPVLFNGRQHASETTAIYNVTNYADEATAAAAVDRISVEIADAFANGAKIFEHRFDALAAMALMAAVGVALLGISVTATICMALLIVGTLIVSSSILVGFFYANISIWSQHGYFIAGFEGVCTAASHLLRPMIGLEMVGSLVEETTNPQNRFAVFLPLMNSLLFFYLFLISVIITLIIPYYEIPLSAALPAIYGKISVPASRYVLSVGSVCALSGALLSALLPPIRYLHTLSIDGLLGGICSKFFTKIGHVPLAAFSASVTLTIICLFFESTALLSMLRILLPARFLVLTAATLMQRYRDTPSGLLAEVANYKSIQFKSKSLSSFLSGTGTSTGGGSGIDGFGVCNGRRHSINSRNASDRYSISSSFIMRNVAAAQFESCPDDDDEDEDEDSGQETLFEHRDHGKGSWKKSRNKNRLIDRDDRSADRSINSSRRRTDESPATNDEVTIFSKHGPRTMPPRSITGELSSLLKEKNHDPCASAEVSSKIKKSATSVSFQSISLTEATTPIDQNHSRRKINGKNRESQPHNCIRSPCTPTTNSDPFYHLYQRDTPEGMPYCDTFSMYTPSTTAVNQCMIYRKAVLWLGFCVCAHLACAICVVRGWSRLESGAWWMYLMATMSFGAAVVATVALGWLPQNVDNRVRHQVPAVPYLALLNMFLLSLMLASADFGGVWKVGVVLGAGIIVYAAYGYRHSVENQGSIAPQQLSGDIDENAGLVAPLSTYQMSETTSKNSFRNTSRENDGIPKIELSNEVGIKKIG